MKFNVDKCCILQLSKHNKATFPYQMSNHRRYFSLGGRCKLGCVVCCVCIVLKTKKKVFTLQYEFLYSHCPNLLHTSLFDYSVCFIRVTNCSIRVSQSIFSRGGAKITREAAVPLGCYAYANKTSQSRCTELGL